MENLASEILSLALDITRSLVLIKRNSSVMGKPAGLHCTTPSKPEVVVPPGHSWCTWWDTYQAGWRPSTSTPRNHGLSVVVPLPSLAEGLWLAINFLSSFPEPLSYYSRGRVLFLLRSLLKHLAYDIQQISSSYPRIIWGIKSCERRLWLFPDLGSTSCPCGFRH